MTEKKSAFYKLIPTISFVIFIAVFRFIPHIPNATPLGYSALYASKTRGFFYGISVPLLALLISDIFIGMYNPSLMAIVYGSFLIYPFLGYLRRINVISLSAPFILISASTFFFFTTNIGVWALSHWYPKTPVGLFMCLLAGVPFFVSMIFGDLVSLALHRLFAYGIEHMRNDTSVTHPPVLIN